MARHIHYSALKIFSKKVEVSSTAFIPSALTNGKKKEFSLLSRNSRENNLSTNLNSIGKLKNSENPTSYLSAEAIPAVPNESVEASVVSLGTLSDAAIDKLEEKTVDSDVLSNTQAPVPSQLDAIENQQKMVTTVAEYIAQTIVGFCSDNDAQSSNDWSIRIALREDILKSTTLHMTLSRDSLKLRFEIHDPDANILISNEVDKLQSMLDLALMPQREVFITLS
jgi:Type III secretion protein (HpaP)